MVEPRQDEDARRPSRNEPVSLEGASLWPTRRLSVNELCTYVRATLAAMVLNRDVKWDDDGEPNA